MYRQPGRAAAVAVAEMPMRAGPLMVPAERAAAVMAAAAAVAEEEEIALRVQPAAAEGQRM
jgi:hypothetical protein